MLDHEEGKVIVVDFEAAKNDRKFNSFLEMMKKAPPIEIDLNLTERGVDFSSFGSGGGDDPKKDRVTVTISEMRSLSHTTFAALRLSRTQWEEIKKHFDGNFDTLQSISKRRK